MVVLITGPVRSGKSARAVRVARTFGVPVTYVATARVDPTDAEMVARVNRHRLDRGPMPSIELWTPDCPDLPAVIAAGLPEATLLIDSLGSWISGHLYDLEATVERDPLAAAALLEERIEPLLALVETTSSHLVFVNEEVGWGIVPVSPLARIFRDTAGRFAQQIARRADRVELVVAGYALDITTHGVPIES